MLSAIHSVPESKLDMKITILNGNPDPSALDEYLVQLKNELEMERLENVSIDRL
jgi:hypothetical protein